jgi:hypothetical protein
MKQKFNVSASFSLYVLSLASSASTRVPLYSHKTGKINLKDLKEFSQFSSFRFNCFLTVIFNRLVTIRCCGVFYHYSNANLYYLHFLTGTIFPWCDYVTLILLADDFSIPYFDAFLFSSFCKVWGGNTFPLVGQSFVR